MALLGAAALVQFFALVADHRTYFAAPDNTEQFFAWYQKLANAVHHGSLPVWDQNALSGHSFAGETQTGIFYPLNLLWVLVLGGGGVIGPRRLDALVVMHLFIGSAGMYALLRSIGLRRVAALAGGGLFAYTGPVAARAGGQSAIFFGLELLPWALFFAHRYGVTGRLRHAAAAGVPIGLSVLAGHLQPAFHGTLAVLLLLALVPAAGRRAAGAAAFVGVAVLVALPQLAYSLPYFHHAYRFTSEPAPIPPGGKVSFETFSTAYSGGPESVLSLLNPERFPVPDGNQLFLGLAALVLLVLGCTILRRDVLALLGRGVTLTVAALVAVGALAMLGPWTPFPRVLYALPFVAQVRELGRYSVLVHIGLCIVVAAALQAALLRPLPRRVLAVGGALVAINGLYLLVEKAPGLSQTFAIQLLLAGALLLGLAFVRPARLGVAMPAAAALVAVGGAAAAFAAIDKTSSPYWPPRFYARTPLISYVERTCAGHRTLLLDDALPRNIGDVFAGIRTQNGYGATMHVPYFDFINSTSWTAPEETRLLDLRCIVARTPQRVPGYKPRYSWGGATVYVDTRTSALNTPQLQPVPAATLADGDRRDRWRLDLSQPTTVVVSALDYGGFKLRLDGAPVRHGAFRVHGEAVFPEVRVPAGRHELEWSWSGWPL